MIDKNYINESIDNFNMRLEIVKNEINKTDGSFDHAIANIRQTDECIKALERTVSHMKQESHDLIQDVYNKFKNKGYVSTIKF